MAKETWKNSLIKDTYVDLRGVTVDYPNKGQRELGLDFETGEELADLNEIISTSLNCEICGIPFEKKKDICKTVGKKVYCKDCIDQSNPRSN